MAEAYYAARSRYEDAGWDRKEQIEQWLAGRPASEPCIPAGAYTNFSRTDLRKGIFGWHATASADFDPERSTSLRGIAAWLEVAEDGRWRIHWLWADMVRSDGGRRVTSWH